ncbi:hypothetical protein EDD68_10787 [Melghiribacillus thermohalophilus]|uniref:Uncharacterized protein n=1 Tax=Melghiribacillus thermohalophilus TaxID=1324956 RepID=A0A4R3N8E4_9BACI|nr:hypothetical protein [Melghiribacillus thermohalophilus]TCT23373.1 hypothetical protein EDD68_10787 [Melghiribacillus thermohalophilus]
MKPFPVEIQKCEGFWLCVTPDAVVQSFGTIIAAIGGVLGAYLLLRKEFRYKEKEKEYIFKLEFRKAKRWVDLSLEHLERFHQSWENGTDIRLLIDGDEKLLQKTNEMLRDMSSSIIPSKILDDYDGLEYEFSGFTFYLNMYKNNLFLDGIVDEDNIRENLRKSIDSVNQHISNITNKIDL